MATYQSLIFRKGLFVIIAITQFLVGCKSTTEPNENLLKQYPSLLMYSADRYTIFINTWNKFNQKYNLNITTPQIDSVLIVPQSLNSISGFQIDLFPDKGNLVSLEDVRERFYSFIDEWGTLFNCSSSELVELKAKKESSYSGSIYYFKFIKNITNELKTVGWRCDLFAQFDSTGKMRGISSNCIPKLSTPSNAEITSEKAKQSLIGKELTFWDWTGQKSFIITNEHLKEDSLVVALIPRYQGSSLVMIEYRICWEYKVPVFYVYADAITGEDINYQRQYIIF